MFLAFFGHMNIHWRVDLNLKVHVRVFKCEGLQGSNIRPCEVSRELDILNYQKYTIPARTAQGGGGSFKDRTPIGEVFCFESCMAEQTH